ncbi:MAG: hypothetical protein SFU85_13785 [Candidatus Methylacidiphilales bacterium]|nr:hypothetical protein [Candidatus Methylacidiphilales bacterium]
MNLSLRDHSRCGLWMIFALCAAVILAEPTASAQTFDCEIPARPADNFTVARFRCLIPAGLETVRGVLVLVPGHNEDGRPLVDKDGWPAFASEHQLALLGCQFEDDDRRDYSNAMRGSGLAVTQALRDFDRLTGRRDLGQSNFMVWGISSGAQFAASMTLYKADKMMAFVSVLGAWWTPPYASSRRVPGLFVSATDQPDGAAEKTRKLYLENRTLGANWALLELDQTKGTPERVASLAKQFLADSLNLRQKPETYPGTRLENISQLDGWVLRDGDDAIVSAAELSRAETASSFWFPSRAAAEAWLQSRGKTRAK